MAIFNGSVDNIENNKNKVNTISEDATPEQYPNVQAVLDFVEETVGDIETLLGGI